MFNGNLNNSNHLLNDKITYNQYITPGEQNPFQNNSKKKVTFNNKVDVVHIESYKEFNKIEDNDFNSGDYFQIYPNSYDTKKNNNKKNCNCACNIL